METEAIQNMKFTKNELDSFGGIAHALAEFHALYSDMTAMQMRVFIVVCRRGKLTGKEIANALDISGSNVSRCVAVLSDINVARRKGDPLNLVELSTDPLDRRIRYVQLSEKGKLFAKQLLANF
jgi:DNA-binding MarR family transcriptional regulator